jgi:hypothetical protein
VLFTILLTVEIVDSLGNPSEIASLIVAIIIYTVYCEFRIIIGQTLYILYIIVKVLKILLYCDPPTSIMWVVFMTFMKASPHHFIPSVIEYVIVPTLLVV